MFGYLLSFPTNQQCLCPLGRFSLPLIPVLSVMHGAWHVPGSQCPGLRVSRKVKRGKKKRQLSVERDGGTHQQGCCVQLTFSIKIFFLGLVTSFLFYKRMFPPSSPPVSETQHHLSRSVHLSIPFPSLWCLAPLVSLLLVPQISVLLDAFPVPTNMLKFLLPEKKLPSSRSSPA